jgi:hypothetical protein
MKFKRGEKMITKEQVLNLLVTTSAICANEILRIFVKDDLISAVLFGVLSIAMLVAFIATPRRES